MSSLSSMLLSTPDHSLVAVVPDRQLLNGSLHLKSSNNPFNAWSAQNHADSYSFMQRIAKAWKSSNLTDQYLIYGKIGINPFNWEMVPYKKCHTVIGRVIQQLKVLWRTVFGGITVSDKNRKIQLHRYETLLKKAPENTHSASNKSNDAFCKQDTIERQWVVTGKKVNVLFNYAPIGFGGERLHFLIVPKQHREAFTDVTQDEYCESIELTKKLVNHFSATRKNMQNVYLLNKTGKDAGQSVKHWHLHVIFSTNTAQDFWGKLSVFKNILLGSSPMNKEELARKVTALRDELKSA